MPKLVTITLTLAEARALRGRALAGLDEAYYDEPDGTRGLLIPRPTYAAAERAIERLEQAIGENEGRRQS